MKPYTFLAAACAAILLQSPAAHAQTDGGEMPDSGTSPLQENRIRIGLRGGLNLAKLGGDASDYSKHDLLNKTGFHVGVIADLPLYGRFWLQPGIFLSAKGMKARLEQGEVYGNQYNYYREEQNMRMLFLEVPVLVSYHYDLGNEVQLQVATGPYFAYGIDGKTTTEWERTEKMFGNYFYRSGTTETKTFRYDAEADTEAGRGAGMKRFDMGWNIGAGITFRQIYLGLSYELGFLNLCDKKAWGEDSSLRTRTLQVSVGYTF